MEFADLDFNTFRPFPQHPIMPPRTCSNKQTVTCKRQASNVDETVNKRPKTKDNNDQDDKKKKKKRQTKTQLQK